MMTKKINIRKDLPNKKIFITREFDAPVSQVWNAFTQSNMLDKWWAPKPWKAETKSMNFNEGGKWLYSMVGPGGERHWSRVDYEKIVPQKSFDAQDFFTDENGKELSDPPGMHWHTQFKPDGNKTKVETEISFANEADLNKILEMGFEEGYSMSNENLDALLAN